MAIPIHLFGKEELSFTDHTRECCSVRLAASSSLASMGFLGFILLKENIFFSSSQLFPG